MSAVPRSTLFLLALIGCGGPEEAEVSEPPPLDLAEPLGPGEVRAGRVTSDDALFGGISAEGQVGDFKIYNDRVQFVIQGVRPGSFYLSEGGVVIDADIVRPEGQPGRDPIDEWATMIGIGRIVEPTSVDVVSDGRDGSPAIIRTTGRDAPLAVLEGALEVPNFVTLYGLEVTTEYVLAPDSWLLEVRTTISSDRNDVDLPVGDVVLGAPEIAQVWSDGLGFGEEDGRPRSVAAYMGTRNDVAAGVIAAPGQPLSPQGGELLTSLADMVVAFGPQVTIPADGSVTVTRYYGVAPDLATLTDAALALSDQPTETVSGVVEAADGPVAGARVVVSVDGEPFTLAVTDAEGAFSAQVPAGAAHSVLADGRGDGLFTDLPPGAGPWSPYAAATPAELTLQSLTAGAPEVPFARGRGFGSESAPLSLGTPHPLVLASGDGLPFTATLTLQDDPSADGARVQGRPGPTVAAWARDGEVEVLLEPGTYDVLVHRGMRYEAWAGELVVGGDAPSRLDVELPLALEHPGWILGDPHSHASPSPDGRIPMEDRLVTMAAGGIQLHFGTDHDHIADYRPVLDALGLGAVMASVVADEVSPPLRGHLNIYPIRPEPELPNNGAFSWWYDIPSHTREITDSLRAMHGDDFIIQSNHPWRGGLASSANWSTGVIQKPTYWTDDFQAVEIINKGGVNGMPFYFDLINRGYQVTPVGVSDSHGYFDGSIGIVGTFLAMGIDDAADYTDDGLVEAMRAGRTVVSRGVFLDLSVMPGSVLTGPTELSVVARTPSWATVDRLVLYRDGVIEETVEGAEAVFTLQASSDASFVVVAEGDEPMHPVLGSAPFAMTAAYLLDVDGDGWDAPLPRFETD